MSVIISLTDTNNIIIGQQQEQEEEINFLALKLVVSSANSTQWQYFEKFCCLNRIN